VTTAPFAAALDGDRLAIVGEQGIHDGRASSDVIHDPPLAIVRTADGVVTEQRSRCPGHADGTPWGANSFWTGVSADASGRFTTAGSLRDPNTGSSLFGTICFVRPHLRQRLRMNARCAHASVSARRRTGRRDRTKCATRDGDRISSNELPFKVECAQVRGVGIEFERMRHLRNRPLLLATDCRKSLIRAGSAIPSSTPRNSIKRARTLAAQGCSGCTAQWDRHEGASSTIPSHSISGARSE